MKRLAGGRPAPDGVDVVYADLDATILGPGGSLFASDGGGTTLRAAEALEALHAAGVALVVMSGRTRRSAEVGRALGARAYIAELGAFLLDWTDAGREEVVENFGAFAGDGSPAEAIARSGAGGLLLERFPGRLKPVAPWAEATMMFHGLVDAADVERALVEAGFGWLSFNDNGRLRRRYDDLDVPEVRAYHLLPRGVSKASAVRLHMERHGVDPARAVAIGDSPADLVVAGEVAAFFLVANGLEQLPDGATLPGNARVTSARRGEGFAEAVGIVLAR